MKPQETKEHLAQAERHVALGAKYVARQREIIGELERDGQDAGQAWSLLALFEQVQAIHVVGRDRLLRDLEQQGGPTRA
jgi:hypothetical protein